MSLTLTHLDFYKVPGWNEHVHLKFHSALMEDHVLSKQKTVEVYKEFCELVGKEEYEKAKQLRDGFWDNRKKEVHTVQAMQTVIQGSPQLKEVYARFSKLVLDGKFLEAHGLATSKAGIHPDLALTNVGGKSTTTMTLLAQMTSMHKIDEMDCLLRMRADVNYGFRTIVSGCRGGSSVYEMISPLDAAASAGDPNAQKKTVEFLMGWGAKKKEEQKS